VDLQALGWNDFFQDQLDPEEPNQIPARVTRQDLTGYQVECEHGQLLASLPGKFHHDAQSRAEIPTVGDWVMLGSVELELGKAQIQRLLTRKTRFSRREPGEKLGQQVVAANIDTVFIVSGLDDNFNLNRIQRYLLLTWESGAEPCILLNKSDLCRNIEARIQAVEQVAHGTRILAISGLTGDGLQSLKDILVSGTTSALLGSSGVGKSTIINTLLGFDYFETNSVRETDSRGRHTTTHREMARIPGAGLIIDTPGMREIQIWADRSSLAQSFADLEELSDKCKFRDCMHDTEPGCAVKSAIDCGDLSANRLTSYRKLLDEINALGEQQELQRRLDKNPQARKPHRPSKKK
jgi:ribosome biogenesis GTPase